MHHIACFCIVTVATTAGDKEFQMEAAKPPERFSADFVMGGVAAIMAESLLLSGEVTRAMSYDTSLCRYMISPFISSFI